MTVAASFGLAAALSVVVLGDESGYTAGENQKMKIAAIEAMWDTEAGAGLVHALRPAQPGDAPDRLRSQGALDAGPDCHALDRQGGCRESTNWSSRAEERIRSGLVAYSALESMRADREDMRTR